MPLSPSYLGYVYLIGSRRFGWYKIGRTRYAQIRVQDLGVLLPFKIAVFAIWKTPNPDRLESYLHREFSANAINGEWFGFEWEKIHEILSLVLPFQAALIESEYSATYSNVHEDQTIDGYGAERKECSRAFMDAMKAYLAAHGLEPTTENKKLARMAVKQTFCWTSPRKFREPVV